MRLSRKQQGCKPPEVRILLLREPRMKIVPMRGDYRGLAGVPLNRKHWHGWWAVRQRRSPAKTVGAEVPGEFDSRAIASRSAVIGHGIGPGIQSAKNGLDRHGGTQSGIRVRCVRAHSSLV